MLINDLIKTDNLQEKRVNKLKQYLIPIGMITLASSIIINRFLNENGMLDFVSGFLIGLSIVANLVGIIMLSTAWRKNRK